jgi:hypothetical protein
MPFLYLIELKNDNALFGLEDVINDIKEENKNSIISVNEYKCNDINILKKRIKSSYDDIKINGKKFTMSKKDIFNLKEKINKLVSDIDTKIKNNTCLPCNYSTYYPEHFRRHITSKLHKKNCKKITIMSEITADKTLEIENKLLKKELDDLKTLVIAQSILTEKLNEKDKEHDKLINKFDKLTNRCDKLSHRIKTLEINLKIQIKSNIKFRELENEDISFITDKDYNIIFNEGIQCIEKLVKYIYFNENYPQNHIIAITNETSKNAKLYKNNQWTEINKDELVSILYTRCDDILNDYYEEFEEKMSERVSNNYKKYLENSDYQYILDNIDNLQNPKKKYSKKDIIIFKENVKNKLLGILYENEYIPYKTHGSFKND